MTRRTTEAAMAKDWNGSIFSRKGRLYLYVLKDGKWREIAAGVTDTAEGRAEAEALLAEMVRKLKAQANVRRQVGGDLTVERYAKDWLANRTENTSSIDDEQRLVDHVYPAIGTKLLADVRAGDVKRLVDALRRKTSARGGLLAPRTIRNVYSVLSAMFRDAVIDEKIPASPCILRGAHLPAARDAVPGWRDTAIFELSEVALLVHDERIPWDRRVLYALEFLGCCRFGEASALRWRHYDPKAKPLGKLKVVESYNTRVKITKGTKAERPRAVPVSPELAAILAEWKLRGWRETVKQVPGMDRAPGPDDLIIPSREGQNRSVNHMLKKFKRDLARLSSTEQPEGLRTRRQHDSRRTWLSTVLAAGANETHAKWIAHGPPPTVLGAYTSLPWSTICKVVDGLRLPRAGRRTA
jgi:integrase